MTPKLCCSTVREILCRAMDRKEYTISILDGYGYIGTWTRVRCIDGETGRWRTEWPSVLSERLFHGYHKSLRRGKQVATGWTRLCVTCRHRQQQTTAGLQLERYLDYVTVVLLCSCTTIILCSAMRHVVGMDVSNGVSEDGGKERVDVGWWFLCTVRPPNIFVMSNVHDVCR